MGDHGDMWGWLWDWRINNVKIVLKWYKNGPFFRYFGVMIMVKTYGEDDVNDHDKHDDHDYYDADGAHWWTALLNNWPASHKLGGSIFHNTSPVSFIRKKKTVHTI